MGTVTTYVLKRLAWRHRGKIVKLALVGVVAAALSILVAAFIMYSAMMGTMTVLVGSEDVCQTEGYGGGGPGGGSGGPGDPNYVSQEPSGQALSDIPSDYLPIYRSVGEEYGLDWAILAGVGKIESDHGRNAVDSSAGAQGPMQFMPPTWESKGVDGNGDGQKDVQDPEDAIPAAAAYLKELGAPGDYQDALCQYNAGYARACGSYPDDVMAAADSYRAADKDQNTTPALIPPIPSLLSTDALQSASSSISSSLGSSLGSSVGSSITSLGPRPAHATQNSWDRVDGNMNLHYEENTQYDEALQQAIADWNALGTVNIAPSPSPEETDIWIDDGGDAETGGASGGLAKSDGQTYLHAANMSDNTMEANVGIIGHELGHQLGLDHPPAEELSIMDSPPDTGYITDYDKQEYYARHGQPTGDKGSGGGSGDGSGGEGDESGPAGGAVFPLPEGSYKYENDWGASRPSYAGNHEGIDVYADDGTPISSITAGEVVQNEWTELGGWVVMIEASESVGPVRAGDMLYYAHQLEQSPVAAGSQVAAGDQIGKVGSTGEGPEGTLLPDDRGKHLHVGWYDPTGQRAETASGAMNPYPLLQWLEENGGKVGKNTPLVAAGACPEEPSGGPGGDSAGGPPGSPGGPSGGKIEGSATGKQVVEEAEKYIGTPYVLGGEAECIPYEQMDCTCLTLTVFAKFGYDMPDLPLGQWEFGDSVDGEPQAGDLLIWDDPGDGSGGHSAISLGNGELIHANTGTMDTSITPHWDTPLYLGAKRLV